MTNSLNLDDILSELHKPLEQLQKEAWISHAEAEAAFRSDLPVQKAIAVKEEIISALTAQLPTKSPWFDEFIIEFEKLVGKENDFFKIIMNTWNIYSEIDSENALEYFAKKWYIDAVDLFSHYDFPMNHKDSSWNTVYGSLKALLDSHMDHFDKVKIQMCMDFVVEMLEEKPTIEFIADSIVKLGLNVKYHNNFKLVLKTWNISECDSEWRNMLHIATVLWDFALVKLLLKSEIDKNKKDNSLNTPYEIALMFHNDRKDNVNMLDILNLFHTLQPETAPAKPIQTNTNDEWKLQENIDFILRQFENQNIDNELDIKNSCL